MVNVLKSRVIAFYVQAHNQMYQICGYRLKRNGIQIAVFWVVTSCRFVGGYQRFADIFCLHLRGSSEYNDDAIGYTGRE
jgi:hypothetical protein